MALASSLLRLSPLWASLAAGFKWEDITPHHDGGRGLAESPSLPEDAFVQRVPSETVFVYKLTSDQETGILPGHDGSLELPLCTGGTAVFQLADSGLMPPDLQARYPDIRSYHGLAPGGISADVTVSPVGVRAQVWTGTKRCYVDPHTKGRADLHTVYASHDIEPGRPLRHGPSTPHSVPGLGGNGRRLEESHGRGLADASQGLVVPPEGKGESFTYRLAVACSYEYVQFAAENGGAMALLTSTLTRVSGIWGREVGIRFTLVPDQDKLFTFGQGELPNNNNGVWCEDKRYGSNAIVAKGVALNSYDIAHFFSVGDSGGLGGGWPCDANSKHNGGTAGTSPKGDGFDVEYVAHEMGHQFGTSHTWSGSKGSCTPDQFMAASAVELGSGSTLETYAGICGSTKTSDDNIAPSSASYFHVFSMHEFGKWQQNSQWGGKASGCGIYEQTNNNRPTVTVPATCAVPRSTPFRLTGSAVDADTNDTLVYNWEQLDSSPKRVSVDVENQEGPLFISVEPTVSGQTRYFPKESTVLNNAGTTNEDKLERTSSVRRSLHLALTARDRYGLSAGGVFGSWHTAVTTVQVAKYGPLVITSPTKDTAINTGSLSLTFELQGANVESTEADDVAVAAGTFEVAYSTCPNAGDTPSAAGCGAPWVTLATGEKLSNKGKGAVTVYLPDSAAGKVVFRVVGSAKGASAASCAFWTATPMLTATVGTTVPTLTASLPAGSATAVSVQLPKITLTFSSPVFLGTAGQVLSLTPAGGSAIAVNAADTTITGSVLEAKLSSALTVSTVYTVAVAPGAVCKAKDQVPCQEASIVSVASFSFMTDATDGAGAAPTLAAGAGRRLDTISPDNGFLALRFGVPVVLGTGSVNITADGDTELWCDISIKDPDQVTLQASTNTVNISLALCGLWPDTKYNVAVPAGAVQSLGGVDVAALTTSFTTSADTTAPMLQDISPGNNSMDVPEYSDFSLTFNEYIDIKTPTANIVFKALTAGKADVSVPLNDASAITLMNDAGEIIITPRTELQSGTKYSLVIPSGALKDYAGNSFPGLAQGAHVFTTGDTSPPELASATLTLGSQSRASATLTFSDGAVLSKGRGNFYLVDPRRNSTAATLPVSSDSVTIDANVVVVSFAGTALPAGTFSLRYNGGVLRDSSSNGVYELDSDTYTITVQGVETTATTTTAATTTTTPANKTLYGTVTLTVPNASAFVASSSARDAVAAGIADTLGINARYVTVQLSLARRLAADDRRLQSGQVRVSYTVSVPPSVTTFSTTTATSTLTSNGITATLGTNIQRALTAAGATGAITVNSVSVPDTTTTTVTTSRGVTSSYASSGLRAGWVALGFAMLAGASAL